MAQLIYDKLNDFGTLTVNWTSSASAGDFPNILALGDDSLERMTVDLKTPAGAVTGAGTLTVKGSATEGGAYTTIIASPSLSAADLAAGYRLPVPKTSHKFIKAALAGTFAGTIQAIVNSYLGK